MKSLGLGVTVPGFHVVSGSQGLRVGFGVTGPLGHGAFGAMDSQALGVTGPWVHRAF